jgi:ClpP class serine protease
MSEITNNKLLSLFFNSQWLIDESAAREALATYLREEKQIQSGVKYSELGISARRHAQKPTLLSTDNTIQPLTAESISSGTIGQIAHIKLSGTMFSDDQLSTIGATSIARDIRIASSSNSVDAILIEVNSGGGEAKSAPIIAGAIKDSSKPVIAFVHTAASAAYWAIAGADEIVMSSTLSEAGSIGAYITMDKVLVSVFQEEFEEIYSDLSPEKNKIWRAYEQGDSAPMKEYLNDLVKIFHKEVKSNRPLTADSIDSTLSGGVFFAKDAIKRGLADSIGTLDEAVSKARKWKRKQNKTQSKMNFKDSKLYAFVAKITGKEVESEEKAFEAISEAIQANKTTAKALADIQEEVQRIAEDVNAKTVDVDAIKAAAEANKEAMESLATSEVVQVLTQSVEGLKAAIAANEAKVTAMTNDIAQLKGTANSSTPEGDDGLGIKDNPKSKSGKGVVLSFMQNGGNVITSN